jgi:hypothetical protein
VQLPDIWRQSTLESRNAWLLTNAGCNHHISRAKRTCVCLNSIAIRDRHNGENQRFVPYREVVLLDVFLEIGDKLVAAEKSVGVLSWYARALKLRLPVGVVQRKGVPSVVPPRIGWLCSLFEDDMIPTFELQMITNRKTSLSTSDDYGVKFPESFHDATSHLLSAAFIVHRGVLVFTSNAGNSRRIQGFAIVLVVVDLRLRA